MLDTVLPNPVVNVTATAAPPVAGSVVSASRLNAIAEPALPPVAPAPPPPPLPPLLPHPVQAMNEAKRAVLKIAVRMVTSGGAESPLIAME
jgi:hypothetical protein